MKWLTTKNALPGTSSPGKRRLPWIPVMFAISLVALLEGCRKHDYTPPLKTQDLELVAKDLVSPLTVTEAPDGTNRLFVLDQIGKVWIFSKDGSMKAEPFIDISSKMIGLNANYDERGLLGMAFHPHYQSNGRFFLFYTAPPRQGGPAPGVNWNNLTRISEFTVSPGNPDQANIGSEKVILESDHPQGNHNGGTIAFGPDGYLYISIGDGGAADDNAPGHVDDWYAANAGGNGQDIYSNLMGDILRIDVNNGNPYSIPADNPYVSGPGLDEIYATGFRNPYRFSFDMGGKHELFVGDAGQLLYEEVDIVTKGGNYGWNVKEGTHCFNTDSSLLERPSCPVVDSAGNPLLDPVIEFRNANNPMGGGVGTTVVGGNVYRGKIDNLKGRYIFGVFSQSSGTPDAKVFVGKPSKSGLWSYEALNFAKFPNHLGQYLKGFGQDMQGEVYLLTSGTLGPSGTSGKVYKIVSNR